MILKTLVHVWYFPVKLQMHRRQQMQSSAGDPNPCHCGPTTGRSMFHKCNVKLCCEDQRRQGSGGRQRDAQVCVRNKTMTTIEGLMLRGHRSGQHRAILFQTDSNVGVLAESYLAVTDKEQLSQHKDYCPVWKEKKKKKQLEKAAVHLLFLRKKGFKSARNLDIYIQCNLLQCYRMEIQTSGDKTATGK